MKVYFISGLAADRKVFKHIKLPSHCEIIHLDWIPSLKDESLESYAKRLSAGIDTSKDFSLIGLSMGGMIASEIARFSKPIHTVLISSSPSAKDLPFYFKWAAKTGLYRLTPISLLKSLSLIKRLFSAETSEDKEMLKGLIRDSDSKFIYWSMRAILLWKTQEPLTNYVHIHGSKDELLPIRFFKPTHIIQKAGHLMIMNRADEINAILADILKADPSAQK